VRNLVLVTVDGGIAQEPINLVGETDVVTIDWDLLDMSSSSSQDRVMAEIADIKIKLYPWREIVPREWALLLQTEQDWLEGAEGDAHLTYDRHE
jgi:hypothetical protein